MNDGHLTDAFNHVQQYNMRLNIVKFTLEVSAKKLLGLYLIERGIEEKPDKCDLIIKMEIVTTTKNIAN